MTSARVLVDSVEIAAETLARVMENARESKDNFEFGPLDAYIVLSEGLYLEGNIEKVLNDVLEISGANLAT